MAITITEPFVHQDGAYLTWAIGLLGAPGNAYDPDARLRIDFLIDGTPLDQQLVFGPGVDKATVAFHPAPVLIADTTTLALEIVSNELFGAAGLAVHCRFTRLDA